MSMNKLEIGAVEKKRGTVRKLLQIEKTIKFEFLRNWAKLLAMLGTSALIYILNIIIEVLQLNRGVELPDSAVEYAQSYLSFLTLFIYIVGVTFAGSMIVEDFEKNTGNLLFPNIPKYRLLIGRYIARYVYGVISILVYYVLIGITTYIRFDEFPIQILLSFGWAAYYLFAVFAFVTLFSSFFKRTAGATIVSLLVLLILFQMIQTILAFTGVELEPLFFLTYYSNIITSIFSMPTERYAEVPFGGPGGTPGGETYFQWITPSELGAGVGLLIYSIVLITIAYIIYSFRQNKGNM